jgi:hypothetical protein
MTVVAPDKSNLRRRALEGVGGVLHGSGAFRFLHRRLLPGNVSVLMYHGLLAAPLEVPEACFVGVERFERQMEYLVGHFEVLHLEEALTFPRDRAARPVACVTFDDGFASVHDLALPILRRFRIAATVVPGDRPHRLGTDSMVRATSSGDLRGRCFAGVPRSASLPVERA